MVVGVSDMFLKKDSERVDLRNLEIIAYDRPFPPYFPGATEKRKIHQNGVANMNFLDFPRPKVLCGNSTESLNFLEFPSL